MKFWTSEGMDKASVRELERTLLRQIWEGWSHEPYPSKEAYCQRSVDKKALHGLIIDSSGCCLEISLYEKGRLKEEMLKCEKKSDCWNWPSYAVTKIF